MPSTFYLVVMTGPEIHHAIRSMLLDVLEQCAAHMDAVPARRALFKPMAYAAHAALEAFERQFRSGTNGDLDRDLMLYSRAEDMTMEWLQTMQEVRKETTLEDSLEHLPHWPLYSQKQESRLG